MNNRIKTPNVSFTVSIHPSSVQDVPSQRPTLKMSQEELRVLLEIDASTSQREETFERTKHTRQTIEMPAIKA
jgi:hypothetical protein